MNNYITNFKKLYNKRNKMSKNMNKKDVVGIGNAIVDIITDDTNEFLHVNNIKKGSMKLCNEKESEELYKQIRPKVQMSGGSAANTIAGIASLGGKTNFIGKLHNDIFGKIFLEDLRLLGIEHDIKLSEEGETTARCIVIVTPDAQRSLVTYLGCSSNLNIHDININVIRNHKITYLEGYLWDLPKVKETMIFASEECNKSGNLVALTLSDTFCVKRHKDSFLKLIKNHVDILFANENEIMELYNKNEIEKVTDLIKDDCETVVITRGEKGSIIINNKNIFKINSIQCQVVDTTGAGDLYASGFLYGITKNKDLETCGKIGTRIAAEIISNYGARSKRDLRELVINEEVK